MAPPRHRPDAARYRTITLRVADDELDQIQLAAAQAGVSTGAYVRGTALADLQRQQQPNTAGAAT